MTDIQQTIQNLANDCVKCGTCLPHCPTYQLHQTEAESPRGRIALIDGISSGRLAWTEKLQQHLDQCLSCRACEAVCPANVAYGKLIDQSRTWMQNTKPKPIPFLVHTLVTKPTLRRLIHACLRGLQITRLQSLLKQLPWPKWIARYNQTTPKLNAYQSWHDYYPTHSKEQGQVGLFIGCMGDLFGRDISHTCIELLNKLGYGVHIPKQQNCCGALHQHAGIMEQAEALKNVTLASFSKLPINTIITTATGCDASLSENIQGQQAIVDIHQFLSQTKHLDNMSFDPLPTDVFVHLPCTHRNTLKTANDVSALLKHIPEISLHTAKANYGCCGAAGLHMLTKPQLADALLEPLLNEIQQSTAKIVVSSNLGCSLHIAKSLTKFDKEIRVLHPLQLLNQQISRKNT